MRIVVESHKGDFKQIAWYIKESESGFYCCFDDNDDIQFKFPWKLYTYKKLEEK